MLNLLIITLLITGITIGFIPTFHYYIYNIPIHDQAFTMYLIIAIPFYVVAILLKLNEVQNSIQRLSSKVKQD